MNHKIRKQLKSELRPFIFKHWWKFILIYLPFVIFTILYSTSSKVLKSIQNTKISLTPENSAIILVLSLIVLLFYVAMRYSSISIHFKIMDIIRYNGFNNGIKKIMKNGKINIPKSKNYGIKSFLTIFKEHRFWSVFRVGFFKWLWTILWALIPVVIFLASWILDIESGARYHIMLNVLPLTCLVALPCLIKNNYSYNFSQYLFRDLDNAGKDISCRSSITLSRILLNHHKFKYLILQLSFWDWFLPVALIASGVTYYCSNSISATIFAGLTAFYCMKIVIAPYMKLLEFIFYQELINQHANNGDKLYQDINKEIQREQNN